MASQYKYMKVAHLTKPWLSIPPAGYGGIERIVYDLVHEQSKHSSVVLFASGDSQVDSRVELISCFNEGQAEKGLDRNIELAQAVHCVQECQNQDINILHVHSVESYLGISNFFIKPCVFTFHSNPTSEGKILVNLQSASPVFTFLSNYHREQFPWIESAQIIYPGVNLKKFNLNMHKQEYLAYVGRISVQKGTLDAIEIARRAQLPIKIAGKARNEDYHYFNKVLAAIKDYNYAEFIGEINDTERNHLLGNALGLLFPITSGEAFGLVQIEAMAVGTPVITYKIGAAQEIVSHGKTGYIVKNLEEAVEAVLNLANIDPTECQQHIVNNFTIGKMAKKFSQLYKGIS